MGRPGAAPVDDDDEEPDAGTSMKRPKEIVTRFFQSSQRITKYGWDMSLPGLEGAGTSWKSWLADGEEGVLTAL